MNLQQSLHRSLINTKNIPTFLLGVWVLYLILSPFYIFPKGRPQPADIILVLAILPVMIGLVMQKSYRNIGLLYLFGGAFVLLTILVNWMNHFHYPHIRFVLSSMMYPYNFMVFIFVVWMFTRNPEQASKFTFYGIVASIIIQLQTVFFFDFGFRGYRGTAGFENPNQLAYWALLSATMLVFLRYGRKLRAIEWIMIGILAFLQSLALSKAGIIAFGIFILFLLITPKITKKAYMVLAALAMIAGGYLMLKPHVIINFYNSIESVQNVADRLGTIGKEADDNPEARGYYRLVENPMYTLLGAGEASFDRFAMRGYDREIHSGIATMFFAYGIVGASLFGIFLLLIIFKQPWYYILLFTPILLFGLPHQNFRFTHFWVFIGISYGLFLNYYQARIALAIDKKRQK